MSDFLAALTILLSRGVILLVIAFAVQALLRKRSAAVQNYLWRGVMVALLVVPLLTLMPPLWEMPITQNPEAQAVPLARTVIAAESVLPMIVPELLPLEVVNETERTQPRQRLD